jgi:N-acetylmuramoyl-L-alanine amidase
MQITVQKGDTLYSLAKKYHVSVASIIAQNGLASDLLREGQVLTLNLPVGPKFQVIDHYLHRDGIRVPVRSTPNRGGKITPTILVLHDTAGRLDSKSAVDWMTNKAARASAHLCVGRDGSVTQLAPFNVATWHAGKSSYRGRANVNQFSIGIEIVNPGAMTPGPEGYAQAWYKENFHIDKYGIQRVKDADHGDAWWMPYTSEQIAVVTAIAKELVFAYRLQDVTTHYAISPKRKVDVNPLFPLGALRREVYGVYVSEMGRA